MGRVNLYGDIVIVSIRVVQSLFSRNMGCNSAGTISQML
jgi:hypothetical protein